MEQRKRNAIGSNLRRLRMQKAFSQERLAVSCARLGYDLPRATLAKIEAGVRAISDVELFVIAHALKVGVADFFPSDLLRKIRDGRVAPFHKRSGTEREVE
jgi:transcriptional regulator with XRE-family HTH domain